MADNIKIETIADAECWINILHRCSVKDIGMIVDLLDQVRWLQKPWWKRIFRKPPPYNRWQGQMISPVLVKGPAEFYSQVESMRWVGEDEEGGVDELLHALQEVVYCGECPACRKMCSGTILKYEQERP